MFTGPIDYYFVFLMAIAFTGQAVGKQDTSCLLLWKVSDSMQCALPACRERLFVISWLYVWTAGLCDACTWLRGSSDDWPPAGCPR